MPRTTVFLVQQGGLQGEAADPLHTQWITSVRNRLQECSADVTHVRSWREAMDAVVANQLDMQSVSLVFFTRGMFLRAQELKREHPGLNVVLLTANPEGLDAVAGVRVFAKTTLDDFDWESLVGAILE